MRGRFKKSSGSTVSFFAFQDVITGTTGFLIIITIFLALNLDEVIGVSSDADPHAALAVTLKDTLAEIVKLKQQAAMAVLSPNETEETLTRMIDELKRSIARLDPSTNPDPTKILADETPLEREIRIEKQKLLAAIEALKKLLPDSTKEAAAAESKLAALESEIKKVQSRLQQTFDQQNVLRLIPEKSTTNKDPVLVVVDKSGFRIQLFDGSKSQSASSLADLMQTLTQFPPVKNYIVLYFKPSGALHFNDVTRRTRGAGYEIGYDLIPEDIQLETTGPTE
ncbi:hypothetical protein [Prosthecobacter sp.]|uniref:hypothetical protein n=1 Tax=Prosthecobacter sp. TaxID=1965333 RepID=UPI002489DB70|nr:hypothetical protein [Prosthecobacter sp.]MDI1313609.1 hypothetical protein [Prosthecobacter sp.]